MTTIQAINHFKLVADHATHSFFFIAVLALCTGFATAFTYLSSTLFYRKMFDIYQIDFALWMIPFGFFLTILILPKTWMTDPENSFLVSQD